HRLASLDSGRAVAALVADPELCSVFVAFRGSGIVTGYRDGDGDGGVRLGYRATISRTPLAGIAVALPRLLIAADRGGVLHLVHEENGRQGSRLRGPLGIHSLDVYGGWLVAILPRRLSLIGVPDGSLRTSVPLESRVGGFAWAIL